MLLLCGERPGRLASWPNSETHGRRRRPGHKNAIKASRRASPRKPAPFGALIRGRNQFRRCLCAAPGWTSPSTQRSPPSARSIRPQPGSSASVTGRLILPDHRPAPGLRARSRPGRCGATRVPIALASSPPFCARGTVALFSERALSGPTGECDVDIACIAYAGGCAYDAWAAGGMGMVGATPEATRNDVVFFFFFSTSHSRPRSVFAAATSPLGRARVSGATVWRRRCHGRPLLHWVRRCAALKHSPVAEEARLRGSTAEIKRLHIPRMSLSIDHRSIVANTNSRELLS